MNAERTAFILNEFDLAIEKLSANPETAQSMVESENENILQFIVSSMKDSNNSPLLQQKAMTILHHLLKNASKTPPHSRITALGTIEQILKAMGDYPEEEMVQIEACCVLRELCYFQASLESLRRQSDRLPMKRLLQRAIHTFPLTCGAIVRDIMERLRDNENDGDDASMDTSSEFLAYSEVDSGIFSPSVFSAIGPGSFESSILLDATRDNMSISQKSMDMSTGDKQGRTFHLSNATVVSSLDSPSGWSRSTYSNTSAAQQPTFSEKMPSHMSYLDDRKRRGSSSMPSKRKTVHLYIAIQVPAVSSEQAYTSLSNTVSLLQTFHWTILQNDSLSSSIPNIQLSERLPTVDDLQTKTIQTMLLLGDFTKFLNRFTLPKRNRPASLPQLVLVCMPGNGNEFVEQLNKILMDASIQWVNVDPFHMVEATHTLTTVSPKQNSLSVNECVKYVWQKMLPILKQKMKTTTQENLQPTRDFSLLRWRNTMWRNTNLLLDKESYLTTRNLFGHIIWACNANRINFEYVKDSMEKNDRALWGIDVNEILSSDSSFPKKTPQEMHEEDVSNNNNNEHNKQADALATARAMVYHVCCQFVFDRDHRVEVYHIPSQNRFSEVFEQVNDDNASHMHNNKALLLWIDVHDCPQVPTFSDPNYWMTMMEECETMLKGTKMINIIFSGGPEFIQFLHSCHNRIDINWFRHELNDEMDAAGYQE